MHEDQTKSAMRWWYNFDFYVSGASESQRSLSGKWPYLVMFRVKRDCRGVEAAAEGITIVCSAK